MISETTKKSLIRQVTNARDSIDAVEMQVGLNESALEDAYHCLEAAEVFLNKIHTTGETENGN